MEGGRKEAQGTGNMGNRDLRFITNFCFIASDIAIEKKRYAGHICTIPCSAVHLVRDGAKDEHPVLGEWILSCAREDE